MRAWRHFWNLLLGTAVWLGATHWLSAQEGGGHPLTFFSRVFDKGGIIVIIGIGIAALFLIWAIFKFVIGAAFLRKRDNKDRDLGGWKPPR